MSWTPLTLVAVAIHVCGTIASHIIGTKYAGIWDVGHTVLPSIPSYKACVDVMTIFAPIVTQFRRPDRAIQIYVLLVILRGCLIACTVLPEIGFTHTTLDLHHFVLGHSRDFVFSGHAAYVASWVVQAPTVTSLAYSFVHGLMILVARQHYTIDIILAWLLAALIHAVLQRQQRAPLYSLRLKLPTDSLEELQHRVWVDELKQFTSAPPMDKRMPAIVAWQGNDPMGYVHITPPAAPASVDKHCGQTVRKPGEWEIRALTVEPRARRQGIASHLMFSALRYIETHGGSALVIMAKEALVPMYEQLGFRVDRIRVVVGNVPYMIARATTQDIRACLGDRRPDWDTFKWDLPFPATKADRCFHGGNDSWVVTTKMDCDILDAWYPPAPEVCAAVAQQAKEVHRSPEETAATLVDAIATDRGVSPDSIVVGSGSSELIYRCFSEWLTKDSSVLLMCPTYGEYLHVASTVIGCRVDSIDLTQAHSFDLDLELLVQKARNTPYDLIVVVNPNNPTGRWTDLAQIIYDIPAAKIWVDETYIEYVGREHSLETIAASSSNIIVCKSMSKVYALSGLRLAYLCSSPALLAGVKLKTPPWVLSRMAHAAGIAALNSYEYYAAQHDVTNRTRAHLEMGLRQCGFEVIPGCANFVIARHPRIASPDYVMECRRLGLYIRTIHTPVDGEWIRVAVKSPQTTQDMLEILRDAACVCIDLKTLRDIQMNERILHESVV